jgi:hypothetical protein
MAVLGFIADHTNDQILRVMVCCGRIKTLSTRDVIFFLAQNEVDLWWIGNQYSKTNVGGGISNLYFCRNLWHPVLPGAYQWHVPSYLLKGILLIFMQLFEKLCNIIKILNVVRGILKLSNQNLNPPPTFVLEYWFPIHQRSTSFWARKKITSLVDNVLIRPSHFEMGHFRLIID